MGAKGISLVAALGILGIAAAGRADPYVPAYGIVRNGPDDWQFRVEGEGYLLLRDGGRDMLTREGWFFAGEGGPFRARLRPADASPAGRDDRGGGGGYQTPGVGAVRLPHDLAAAPEATTSVSFAGNLSTDDDSPTYQILSSGMAFEAAGAAAEAGTLLAQLDQARGLGTGDEICIAGTSRNGQAVSAVLPIDPARRTLGDLAGAIGDALPDVTAGIVSGRLRVRDNEPGYSRADLTLTYAGGGSLDLNGYFEMLSAGGQAAREAVVGVRDYRGVSRCLSGAFVRTDQAGVWDFVVTKAGGEVDGISRRRVRGIDFDYHGLFEGLDPADARFRLTFAGRACSGWISARRGHWTRW